jgi:hypothetical protein
MPEGTVMPAESESLPATPVSRYAQTEPVYRGAARIADHNIGARRGMTAKFFLLGADELMPHPFKGLKCSRVAGENASGHRLHVAITEPGAENGAGLYAGEALLAWWSEDPSSGMNLSLRLDPELESGQRHPLYGKATGKDGDIVYLACWAVDDDESLQKPEQARRAKRPWGAHSATQQSNILCSDKKFQEWTTEVAAQALGAAVSQLPDSSADPKGYAASFIRAYCRVASRSDLARTTPEGLAAANRWAHIVRRFRESKYGRPGTE